MTLRFITNAQIIAGPDEPWVMEEIKSLIAQRNYSWDDVKLVRIGDQLALKAKRDLYEIHN